MNALRVISEDKTRIVIMSENVTIEISLNEDNSIRSCITSSDIKSSNSYVSDCCIIHNVIVENK